MTEKDQINQLTEIIKIHQEMLSDLNNRLKTLEEKEVKKT